MTQLDIPDHVYNWLVNFFDGHSHQTKYADEMSTIKSISASIIQGSAISPASYVVIVVNGSDLLPVTSGINHLCKCADDTYILIPAINVSTRHAELASIARWAQADNLTLNIAKSREKLFSDKRRKEKFSAPAEIAELKRVCKLSKFLASLLNQWLFSITACSQCHAPKQYALHVLRAHGLCDSALQTVYRAVVVAKLTYASSTWTCFPRQTLLCPTSTTHSTSRSQL